MRTIQQSNRTRGITWIAILFSLTGFVIPICYAVYTIATPTYHRGPLYNEIRLAILILSLIGIFLGIAALCRHTRSKVMAILAIILGLISPLQHVFFCGSDVLQQKLVFFCPMLWGIRIP